MKKNKIITFIIVFFLTLIQWNINVLADWDISNYTVLRDVDKWTFNEYRYYIVREYFKLKETYELGSFIDKTASENIIKYAKTWYNYLPDSLINQNYLNDLSIAIKKWLDTPNSEVSYVDIVKKIDTYIQKVNIQSVKWNIEATPISWNAPITVTFRWRVTDPTWTIIPANNYTWWLDVSWIKKIIWKGTSINYTFNNEWNHTVFLDVTSSHKNAWWYTDVLPFSSRSVIEVKEKIASILININDQPLRNSDEIKFTPEEASYWLIFDGTSSTPTWGAKFSRTEWDFWNWVERKYDWNPKIERVVYSREWNYTVKLTLSTNEWRSVKREFTLLIHKPIATIQTDREDWFIWEKFSFSTRSSINEKNLSYSWRITDIDRWKEITKKNWSILTYMFNNKWKYNIQLFVKDAAWNEDTDSKIIYINSRAPVSEFSFSIPEPSKPNRILFNWTRSFDPDYTDEWKLKYVWTIDWNIVNIENVDSKWAVWYYTFDSIWDYSVTLEVTDPDELSSIKQQKVNINSILSVDMFIFPRVSQRWKAVKFVASSPEAKFYEWDFWDGNNTSGNSDKATHIYEKSWTYKTIIRVKDTNWNSNEMSKMVYIRDWNSPLSMVNLDFWTNEIPIFEASACSEWAYIVDRIKTIIFKWWESINIDGTNEWLSYSWKIWNNKYLSSKDVTHKFDEIWCYPVKLTVKSNKNWASHSSEIWVKVQNLKPTLSTLNISTQAENADPVVVNVQALWANDPDWVIQSYLWYYYTDTDLEPQDFRITSLPNTNFVIPKITWNYYFVVVMRDNNDERYSSQEDSTNRYFISLSWDNINTPLVDFKVNKNSIFAWNEISFSAKVKNVLWQDITLKSEYAWDFDGDWFYDKETTSWEISHKYEKSWTFYAKVRVKYKWMTNVRTIEMNVSNILNPNFEYISIGNKYLFFNASEWSFDKVSWNMWNGDIMDNKNYFSYIYDDNKAIHDVEIKISEGTKSKSKTISITKNIRNMINYKNSKSVIAFSYPEIKNDEITLSNEWKKIYLFINENLTSSWNFSVDFDLNLDSDLNGWKDDDIDNKMDTSFKAWWLIEIPLNEYRIQKIRVFITWLNWDIIDSQDIKITKTYIEEEEIDSANIIFEWITENEKVKIEKLKSYIQELPQEHRLKWMKYIQKLQEEWFYKAEKTKIILEFEWFIDSLAITNKQEIIDLLESFLIEWQQDTSVRNMSYNVVKNLIPKELVEYNEIISNLESINSNPDKLEDNKVLWKEILEMIKDTTLISTEDKITIKTQLQVFIYWGVDKIPQEVISETETPDNNWWNRIIWLFSWIVKFIWVIFWVIIFIIIWFFIWYKVSNKNKNQWLQDFIIEKTSWSEDDVLWDITKKQQTTSIDDNAILRKEDKVINKEKLEKSDITPSLKIEKKETKEEPQIETKEENVPDWLKWALDSSKIIKKEPDVIIEKDNIIQNKNILEVKNDIISTKTESQPKPEIEEKVIETKSEPEIIETKNEEEKVPDWLKWALDSSKISKKEPDIIVEKDNIIQDRNIFEDKNNITLTKNEPEIIKTEIEEKIIETKIKEEKVPDWLKWALDSSKILKEEPEVKENNLFKDKIEIISSEEIKTKPKIPKKIKKDDIIENDEKKIITKDDKEKNTDNFLNSSKDLPDWLKPSTNTKKDKNKDDFWSLEEGINDDSQNKKD